MEEINVGDKYIIEIGEAYESTAADGEHNLTDDQESAPTLLYRIKDFNSLVFDSYGLGKLEKYIAREDETGYQHGYEDGYNAAIAKTAKKIVKLGDCKPGDTVVAGGVEMEVLDTDFADANGTRCVFCLEKNIRTQKAFAESNCNDWRISSLRTWLYDNVLPEMEAEIGKENIRPHTRDLTSDDGLDDYGTIVDRVSLLSCDEYRRYRRYITNKDDTWWTLTPYSTPPSGRSYNARFVGTDGTLNDSLAFDGNIGVAPAYAFLSSLSVEVADGAEK